ncbi:la-related protein 1C-like isoform X2 [Cornus florida]|uniref:la-related protein 1C-like isoform X2 n=1 Tax=Cornus florida TaxID=4283 RepID=UPI0028983DB5|nr:la-related protein 1C-like isoform X2 [Cornus florida]
MATASNSATNNHSPRSSGDSAVNSPKSRRARGVSSPWTQIVRGESESIVSSSSSSAAAPSSPSSGALQEHTAGFSSECSPSKAVALASFPTEDSAVEAQPDSSDNGTGNSNAAKKTAWNRPSNGAADVRPVMGAVSWPALSESTKASPKSSSSESSKAFSDGSVSVSQKQVITNNANPSSTPSSLTPTRHKSTRRGGGSSSGSISANGGFPQPPSPMGPVVELHSNSAGKSGSVLPESSPRDHTYKESGQKGGFGSQTHSGNDNPQQRNSSRRGNSGSHPRGDGSYHHHYAGKRDQDRGNHDWTSSHRNFSRDAPMQTQRVVPRGFLRHPTHSSTPFVAPPPMPVQPYGNPMVYPDPLIYIHGPPAPPESLRGVPIIAPMQPMYFPIPPDPQLHAKIVNQIDYYFSNDNLIKDTFLRRNMDDQGWVSIKLIAGFKKVMQLTDNVQYILDAVRSSTVVEVQGDKVRRRNEWVRWLMPPVQIPTVSSPQSFGRSAHDMLAANLQNVSLGRSSSGDLNSQSQPSSGEGFGQASSERPVSARSSSN